MDVTDYASEREDAHRAAAIAAALAQHEQPAGASAEYCENCAEEIPEARRLAIPGVVLCVDCKSRLERCRGWK